MNREKTTPQRFRSYLWIWLLTRFRLGGLSSQILPVHFSWPAYFRGRWRMGAVARYSQPTVRIIGDGDPLHTRVVDDKGRNIPGAFKVEFESEIGKIPIAKVYCYSVEIGKIPVAKVYCYSVEIDAVGEFDKVILCPRCKESVEALRKEVSAQ